MYVLDINGKTSEEIFKNFENATKNNITKTNNKFNLNIKTLTYDELNQFKKFKQ